MESCIICWRHEYRLWENLLTHRFSFIPINILVVVSPLLIHRPWFSIQSFHTNAQGRRYSTIAVALKFASLTANSSHAQRLIQGGRLVRVHLARPKGKTYRAQQQYCTHLSHFSNWSTLYPSSIKAYRSQNLIEDRYSRHVCSSQRSHYPWRRRATSRVPSTHIQPNGGRMAISHRPRIQDLRQSRGGYSSRLDQTP